MPITLPAPPPAVAAQMESAIKSIASAGHFRVEALTAAKPETIALDLGHRVYNLGLTDIVSGAGANTPAPSAWRFIVRSDSAAPTAAETTGDGVATPAQLASVNSGPFVSGTINGFAAVSNDPGLATGNWELRLLRIPALYIMAVWAHESGGGGDRVYPVAPAPTYLSAGGAYSWSEFLLAIKPEAAVKLAADDGRRG